MQDIAILRTLASYPYVVFSPSLQMHNIMQTLFLRYSTNRICPTAHLRRRDFPTEPVLYWGQCEDPPEDPPRAGPCGGNGSLVDAKLPACLGM